MNLECKKSEMEKLHNEINDLIGHYELHNVITTKNNKNFIEILL